MIAFSCPKCQIVLKTADEQAGLRCKCPKCGVIVQVPRGTSKQVPSGPAKPVSAKPDVRSAAPVAAFAPPAEASVPPAAVPVKPAVARVLPVETPTKAPNSSQPVSGQGPSKRGFPVWLLAVVIPAGLLFLCCGGVGLFIFVGKGGGTHGSPTGDNQATVGGDNSNSTSDFTSDFDALDKWCERSVKEIQAAIQSNAIRGEELKKDHVRQLRDRLLGKEVQWRRRIATISRVGVTIDCSGKRHWKVVTFRDDFGIEHHERVADVYLVIQMVGNRKHMTRGEQIQTAGYANILVTNVTPQRLHELSVGDYAVVSGNVEKIMCSAAGQYGINLTDPKIE